MLKLNFSWACQTTAGPCDTETCFRQSIHAKPRCWMCSVPSAPQHHFLALQHLPRQSSREISRLNGGFFAQLGRSSGGTSRRDNTGLAVVVTRAGAPAARRKRAILPRQSTESALCSYNPVIAVANSFGVEQVLATAAPRGRRL